MFPLSMMIDRPLQVLILQITYTFLVARNEVNVRGTAVFLLLFLLFLFVLDQYLGIGEPLRVWHPDPV